MVRDPDNVLYFDFEKEPWWPLGHAIAWICWRDQDQLAQVIDDNPLVPNRLTLHAANAKLRGAQVVLPQEARELLFRSLSSAELKGIGFSVADGKMAEIPSFEWVEFLAHASDYFSVRGSQGGERYRDVRISGREMLGLWPGARKSTEDQEHDDTTPLTTGLPGKPSKSWNLIEPEFERRITAGELEPRLVDQANSLIDWLKEKYPKAPRPKAKTLTNKIGPRYRRALLAKPENK